MMVNSKKALAALIVCLSLLFTGCSNSFAKLEYDSAEKISQEADHYAKESATFNPIQGGYLFDASKFDGRQTLYSEVLSESKDIEISFTFTLSSGKAKVVLIDADGTVTTIIECSPETSVIESITKKVTLSSGQNRIKFVGYDCTDIHLEMLSDNFE